MFRRKIYSQLLEWKREYAGKYALMIEGARRVGKSTIIQEFAKNEYDSFILLRFDKPDTRILDLFSRLNDLDRFFLLLQQYTNVRLKNRKSAIIFDEVQLFPLARQAIKVLLEDGRYDYYETGSLVSIKKNVKDILIPSEEHTIRMYPMDFEEFLWAKGNDMAMPAIRESFQKRIPLDDALNEFFMELYREYMLVGGMPQAVSAFIDSNSFAEVEKVKREIIELYRKDMAKIDTERRGRKAVAILNSIPSNLEKHDKMFSPGSVEKDGRTRDYLRLIDDMVDSMVISICYRNTDPCPDLRAHCDEDDFKLYLCDTGLLFTMSFETIERKDTYDLILSGSTNINFGMYAENLVAQELRCSGHGLFFSKFEHPDSDRPQEVDFIIVRNGAPCPVEVKSGKRPRQHTSLDRFVDKYSDKLGEKFVVCTRNLDTADGITYIPMYMAYLL